MVHRRKTEIVQVNLRLREELRQRLAKEADKSGRSFNQELVWRLEQFFVLEVELAETKRRISEQDLLKLAQEHLDRAKKLQEGLVEIKDGLLAGTWVAPPKGSRK